MIVKNMDKTFTHPWFADKDETTGQVSKVLKLYSKDDTVRFERFDYADNGEWIEATEDDQKKYGDGYYLDDGSEPYKSK